MGCLTLNTVLDKGDLHLDYSLDKGDLRVSLSLICTVGDYENVLFHVNGPLLVREGYLFIQNS